MDGYIILFQLLNMNATSTIHIYVNKKNHLKLLRFKKTS